MTSARTRDRLVQRLQRAGHQQPRVLDRIRNVPRHIFVDEALASRAYEDTALPIGFGQTISQPYIVARMTEALHRGRAQLGKVLEIGTGCGYQTAVLAPLVGNLQHRAHRAAREARQGALKELGIKNVMLKHGDGTVGWPSQKPFDGILVAAAPLAVPEALFAQLANPAASSSRWDPKAQSAAHSLHAATTIGMEREVLGLGGLRSDARRDRLSFAAAQYSSEFSDAEGSCKLLFLAGY